MIKLRKEGKAAMMIGLLVIAVVCIGLLGKELLSKEVANQENTVYEYTVTGGADYTVNAGNNALYNGQQLPEGEVYITNFINGISVNLVQQFQGNGVAKLDGEYDIIAQVRGYETKEEEKLIIWKRDFSILPTQKFTVEDEKLEINRNVGVDFHGYNHFAQGIMEASEVRSSVEVVVALDGFMNVTTAEGTSKVPLHTGIVIPLNSGYFNIVKEGVGEQPGKIATTVEVAVAKDTKQMMVYALGALVALGGIFAVRRFTDIADGDDRRRSQMKKIMQHHGSRMAAIEKINPTGFVERYLVTNIDDLVKIADELEKPLMYEYREDISDINCFYVLEGKVAYIYYVMPTE